MSPTATATGSPLDGGGGGGGAVVVVVVEALVVVVVEALVVVVVVVVSDGMVGVTWGCDVVGVVGVPGAAGTGDDGFGLGTLTQRWTLM
jgi:hypothetical protein